MTRLFAALSLAVLFVLPSRAQDTPTPPEANPADVESVDAIMTAVYDVISGGQGVERDWDRMRSLFHPNARLIPTGCGQNGCGSRWMSLEDYISMAGPTLTQRGFFEVEIHRIEERFGQMAHIFSTYESRFKEDDAEPFARGINSFQLWNDGNRWWVFNIFWQGETPAAPIPAEYGG